jgi:anti-anti-sigma factor
VPKDFFRQPGIQASTPVISATYAHFGSIAVVHLTGDLDMETVGQAEQALDEVVHDTAAALILDLNGLAFFASTGLNLLVQLKETTHGHGQGLFVVAANRRVLRPLQIAALDVAFEIHPTVEQALTAAQRPPAS